MRGTFTFYRTSVDPLFAHYALANIDWRYPFGDSASGTLRTVRLTGSGTYDLGGEVALTQRMSLDLTSDAGQQQHFDSGTVPARGVFPAIDIAVHARLGVCLDSVLQVVAAPPGVASVGPLASGRLIQSAMPNPAPGALDVVLALPVAGRARVDVVDVGGRVVARLFDGWMGAGASRLRWNGRNAGGASVGAGLFWIRAQVGAVEDERRVVRLR
jgi:hypothetical protein